MAVLATLVAQMNGTWGVALTKTQKCIDKIYKSYGKDVPEVILEIESLFREMNKSLYELPLTKLIKHPSSKIDIEEARFMTDQIRSGEKICSDYVAGLQKSIEKSSCAKDLLPMSNIWLEDYDQRVAEYPKMDKLMGYKFACKAHY